jgi:hypothetical protein
VSGLDAARAQLLEQLAEIALQDLSRPVFLPDGWDVVQFVAGSVSGFAPSAQGFYAKGDLDGSGTEVAVLALGLTWQRYIDKTRSGGKLALGPPPQGVVSLTTGALYNATLAPVYSGVRASIWANLAQALREGNGTLFVTGKGLGGPLAQLAALDLRPGNQGPQNENPPDAVSPCYAFSTPAAANAAFKTFYDGIVKESPVVWAGAADLPVDFFPTLPAVPQGYYLPGTPEPVAAPLPFYDDPWVERSGSFYLSALGGTPTPPPTSPGSVRNPPAGFDRGLAFTFGQFVSIAYLHAQHPGTSSGINIAPYTVAGDIGSGGVPWCTLFTSPDTVVAAFRGTCTFDELQRLEADTVQQTTSFLPDPSAMVLAGALRTYTAPVSGSDATTFRDALLAQLRTLGKGKAVYLAGHAFGGAVASLAAADVRSNAGDVTLRKVYTYGANTLGNFAFGALFTQKVGGDSYQVARPGDFAPDLLLTSGYVQLAAQVVLDGTPPDDDFTHHTLTGYVQLLDPRSTAFRAAPAPRLTAAEREEFHARLAEAGMAPEAARARAAAPARHPRTGHPVHAFETLSVTAGEPLVLGFAAEGPAHVVVGKVAAGPGAQLVLPGGGTLVVVSVAGGDVLTVSVLGADGTNGMSGAPGGGAGRDGSPGLDAHDAVIHLGTLEGGLVVVARGGNGGSGGPGGAGAGGPGGPGGRGGDGGSGSTVTVSLRSTPPGGVQVVNQPARGGAGGAGGPGNPPGADGQPGAPGNPSVVNVSYGSRG